MEFAGDNIGLTSGGGWEHHEDPHHESNDDADLPSADAPPAPRTSTSGPEGAPAAPAVAFKPILRGIIAPLLGGGPRKYTWIGKWAMSGDDPITSEFRYAFDLPVQYMGPPLGAGAVPANPLLPSNVSHQVRCVVVCGVCPIQRPTRPALSVRMLLPAALRDSRQRLLPQQGQGARRRADKVHRAGTQAASGWPRYGWPVGRGGTACTLPAIPVARLSPRQSLPVPPCCELLPMGRRCPHRNARASGAGVSTARSASLRLWAPTTPPRAPPGRGRCTSLWL